MIRYAHLSDAMSLNQINTLSLGYEVTPDVTIKKLDLILNNPNHILLVFEGIEGKVLGYVHGEIYDTLYAPTAINILGLAVLKSHQSQGIGKKLMLQIETEGVKKDAHFIRLNSGSERQGAHRFYEKLGYATNKTQLNLIKHL